jgi:hypothetical protein
MRRRDIDASFDSLRMRTFLRGTCRMPFPISLILSLSKDALSHCGVNLPALA